MTRKEQPTAAPDLSSLFRSAVGFHRQGDLVRAEALYREILQMAPNQPEVLNNMGLLARAQKRPEAAIEAFQNAVALKPGSAEVYANLGATLKDMGRLAEAEAAFLRHIELAPRSASVHTALANVLRDLGRLDEALARHRRAIEIAPTSPEAHSDMGKLLRHMGDLEAAIAAHDRAVMLSPEGGLFHSNRGATLHQLGRLDEALAAYDRCLSLLPDQAEAHWNRSLILLLKGRYAEGWREHEWRLKAKKLAGMGRDLGVPQWDGSALQGRTLFIHAEQGFGDTIQFVRYVRLAKEQGARVLFECPPGLHRLFEANLEGIEVIIEATPLPPFDVHCPLLSLPGIFKTDGTNVPSPEGYLRPLDGVASPVERRPAVGLVWRGRPEHLNDRNRSIPFPVLEPLLRDSKVPFVSLQYGAAARELSDYPWARDVEAIGDRLSDFADTAAAISALDLVIAVDTSVAHLAGALGKPVWMLLPRVPDWRWGMAGEETHWYASMRLFRQDRIGHWEGVVKRVAERLSAEPFRVLR